MKQRPPATELHETAEASLSHADDALWLINDDVGAMAFLPVAPADLIELGRKLQTLGRKLQKGVTHGQ